MKDTGFSVPAGKIDRLPTSYWTDSAERGARGLRRRPRAASGAGRPRSRPAAGGLVSTVDDYLAFGRMLLNRGRHGARAHPVAACRSS